MVRHLLRLIVVVAAAGSMAALHAKTPKVQGHADVTAAALQRFLSRTDEPQVPYRALRHLEAQNPKFKQKAWMDVWTEFDRANGLRYRIVAEGGSQYIRTKVFLAALDGEQKMWMNREPQKASFNHDNYEFEKGTATADGLTSVSVKPRRKDVLLVEGTIFVQPEDGDLARIEGKLSKAPSIWTRRVDIVRRYERIAGERMPISIESVAHVLIAGRSTFKMTYEYEIVNGQHVGSPQPPHSPTSAAAAAAH
ncbi:MAG: hypothetical protein HY048_07200 [Acidobacteria bacterium]|nr:hypothetical protein [Acidobacteriota bacterium]